MPKHPRVSGRQLAATLETLAAMAGRWTCPFLHKQKAAQALRHVARCVFSSRWRCRFEGVTSDSEQTLLPAPGQQPVSRHCSGQVCSHLHAVRSWTCCAGQCGSCEFFFIAGSLFVRGPREQTLLQRTTFRSATTRTLVSMAFGWMTPSRFPRLWHLLGR